MTKICLNTKELSTQKKKGLLCVTCVRNHLHTSTTYKGTKVQTTGVKAHVKSVVMCFQVSQKWYYTNTNTRKRNMTVTIATCLLGESMKKKDILNGHI